jgi:glycosyltransferase involved in cell wall biosynthesis
MLKGQSIVYFAPGKWDGLWRNRHQLMSVFARHNKVLFVERRLHHRKTLADFGQGKLGLSDLIGSPIRHISDNLFVFRYPVWAPICGRLDQPTRVIRRRSIRRTLRKLHMSQPIVWFSQPSMIDLLGEVPSARLHIYHVVDEYTAYSGQTEAGRNRVQALEKEMMTRADAVIVVSQRLHKAKQPFHPHTYLVPNAVNYQAYADAVSDPQLPDDLRAIRRPRLGYIGLIGDKLDFGMLTKLAREHPAWSLVLLGNERVAQQTEAWRALRALPNVHHLGPVEVAQVPHYVKGFQAGLMPYMQNRHAEHISPLKLYDYLAAGLPVATIDIPAVREFASHIHVANGQHDFCQAVRDALADTTPERRQARREIAAQHTWEARVEQISGLIQAHLVAPTGTHQIEISS